MSGMLCLARDYTSGLEYGVGFTAIPNIAKGLGLDIMSYIFLVEQTVSMAEMSPYCGVFCVPRVQLRQSGSWVK